MGLMNEYLDRRMGSAELEEELKLLVKKYNEHCGGFLLIYAGTAGRPVPDRELNMSDYYVIHDMIRDTTSDSLNFYIQTPGGSGETAEEIARCVRNKFSTVSFIVTGEAKSAGTILVLSGDEIMMTECGSLGPIDAQMRIGRSIISAYDYLEYIDGKRTEAKKEGQLNPVDATLIAQITPGEINQVFHALQFGRDLVIDWLPKYKFKNWNKTETHGNRVTEEMKIERANEIATELSNHARWRLHGRSLKIDDLEEIGLKIKKIDDDEEISDMIYRIQTIIRLFFSTTTTYKIYATEDSIILKNAASITGPQSIQPKMVSAVKADVKCENCGKEHSFYAKLTPDRQLDDQFKKSGINPFPDNDIFICECGVEIDLKGIRNEIERNTDKKIIKSEGD